MYRHYTSLYSGNHLVISRVSKDIPEVIFVMNMNRNTRIVVSFAEIMLLTWLNFRCERNGIFVITGRETEKVA